VAKGPPQLIDRLLETGADVDAGPGIHGTAISAACVRSDGKLLKLLLASNPKITLNLLCRYGDSPGYRGMPLYIAALRGNYEAVDLLLEAGADPNSNGTIFGDALQVAAALGYDQIVTKLLQHGADPTSMHGSFGTAYSATLTRSEGMYQHAEDGARESIAKSLRSLSKPLTDRSFVWKDAMAAAVLLAKANDVRWLSTFRKEALNALGINGIYGRLTHGQKDAIRAYYYTVPSEEWRDAIQSRLRYVDGSGLWEEIQMAFDLGQSPIWIERPFTSEYNTVYSYHKHFFRATLHYIVTHVGIVHSLNKSRLTQNSPSICLVTNGGWNAPSFLLL
jgi:hypothetical protein